MARFRKDRLFLNSSESAIIIINMDGKAEERISGLLALNRRCRPVDSTFLRHVIRRRRISHPEFRAISSSFI